MKGTLALLLYLSLVATCSVAKANKNRNHTLVYYKLKMGDTLPTVAKRYHTTTSQIISLNKLNRNKRLKVGKVLKIATKGGKNRKKLVYYKLKIGDSLLSVAKKHHTTVSQIVSINNLSRNKRLWMGKILKVPINTYKKSKKNRKKIDSKEKKLPPMRVAKVKKEEKTKEIVQANKCFHIITKGDTLYSIASQNNTTIAKIKALNQIRQSKRLKIGQKIFLTESSEVNAKSDLKKLYLASNSIELDKKNSKIDNLRKIAFASDRTVRFSKQKVKRQVPDKEIYSLLSLGTSLVKLSIAKKYLGKRYVWGAVGPKSFDCSGFTKYVCNKSGISIPRTSINQSKVGKRVDRTHLKAGDLIFFDTSRRHRGYVNHVGIYMGNNKFIHASSSKKRVVITSLNRPFYKSRFKWGSRIES